MNYRKNQNVIPAQSANFQPMAPFQHVVVSSNPLGFNNSSAAPFQSDMFCGGLLSILSKSKDLFQSVRIQRCNLYPIPSVLYLKEVSWEVQKQFH